MTLNSASHHALLEVIEDKERELSRIRQVASVAAQEETKGLEAKLLELKQDCNRHIELLYDKDEAIQRLQDRLLQMERDHLQATEKVKKSCEELSSVQIAKATAKAEEDIKRRLQREYEDRISRKREDLEKEYQSVLINQIRDQEVMLYDKFDREIANREKAYVQDVNDLQRCIDTKDKEILELVYSSEQKYKERENRILDEVKLRLEGETRNRLEDCERQWKIRMRSLEEEKGQYERELNRIGQDRLQFEVDNRELNWKVEELLSIIQHIQGEADDKCKDFEMHKKQFKREINECEQKIALLETLLKDGEENHQRRLHKVEKRNKMDIKALSNTIKKLKKGIVTLKDERGEADELVKEKEEEIHISRQQLKEKVASLRKECLGLRKEIDIMHTKSLIDTRSESKQKADFVRTLKDSEEAEQSNRRHMRLEHEVEVERIAKQHREEKLCLVRERDDVVIQMDRLEVQIREKNEECKVARNELASIENSLRKELQALKKQNDSIGINNRDVVLQNSQLKETVKSMRNELETLMSSIMEARDQCTCSQSDRQKNSNKDQARKKATERDHDAKLSPDHEFKHAYEKKMMKMSADYEALCIERDHLLHLSNRLRAEAQVHRLQQEGTERSNQSLENIDVDDLAEIVWASAINKQKKPTTQPTKASDRATVSQEMFLKKKLEQKGPPRSTLRANRQPIRNWNMREEDLLQPAREVTEK